MAWKSQNSSFLTVSDATKFFSGVTHGSFYSGSHAAILVDQASGNTGELEISFFASAFDSPDDSWDTTPLIQRSLSSVDDPNQASHLLQGYRRWRAGIRNSSASVSNVTLFWSLD